ncbi:hypothetical protein ES705_42904 [subsurface metagenome]
MQRLNLTLFLAHTSGDKDTPEVCKILQGLPYSYPGPRTAPCREFAPGRSYPTAPTIEKPLPIGRSSEFVWAIPGRVFTSPRHSLVIALTATSPGVRSARLCGDKTVARPSCCVLFFLVATDDMAIGCLTDSVTTKLGYRVFSLLPLPLTTVTHHHPPPLPAYGYTTVTSYEPYQSVVTVSS